MEECLHDVAIDVVDPAPTVAMRLETLMARPTPSRRGRSVPTVEARGTGRRRGPTRRAWGGALDDKGAGGCRDPKVTARFEISRKPTEKE